MSDIKPYSTHAFLNMLVGAWSLKRRVTALKDHAIMGEAHGEAVFTQHDAVQVHYAENGTLYLPAASHANAVQSSFFRSYIYALKENALQVLYGDGPQNGHVYLDLISDPDTRTLRSANTHLCGPDCYDALYSIHDNDTFSLETTVRGPRKDYVIHTEFTRKRP